MSVVKTLEQECFVECPCTSAKIYFFGPEGICYYDPVYRYSSYKEKSLGTLVEHWAVPDVSVCKTSHTFIC